MLFVYILTSEVPNENCVSKCITLTHQEKILKKSLDMIHKYILSQSNKNMLSYDCFATHFGQECVNR